MLVKDAKSMLRQWVDKEASKQEGFSGAFIFGSVNWMQDDDEFPHTSDIDVRIVVDSPEPPGTFSKMMYQGLLIETSYAAFKDFQSPETILADYPTAAHFTRPCIISDPSGQLSQSQSVVQKEFPRRKWVQKRVEAVKVWQLDSIKMFLNKSDPFYEQVFAWIYGTSMFTSMILVADLKNPTVRKAYAASHEVLEHYEQLEFHEKLMDLIGCKNLSSEEVEQLLQNCTRVFDTAKDLRQSEFFGATTISDTGRVTAIDGIQEIITSGKHREAVFWLIVIHSWCQKILDLDAPDDIQQNLMPLYDELMEALGISSLQDIYDRIDRV